MMMIGRRAAALAVTLLLCAPALCATYVVTTYRIGGQVFASEADAITALQNGYAAQLDTIRPFSDSLKGTALIVIPNRGRLMLYKSATARATNATPESLDFMTDLQLVQLRNLAEAIVRTRVFQHATWLELDDTAQPQIGSNDYLVWFQLKQDGADGNWTAHWQVQRRDSKVSLPVYENPDASKGSWISPSLQDFQREASRLEVAAQTGVEPAPAAPPIPAPAAAPIPAPAAAPAPTPVAASAPMPGGSRPWHPISIGSGIVTNTDGAVLTNAHVVSACSEYRIVAGSETAAASLVTMDALNDLAVLKAERHFPVAARFRDGAPIRQGDDVVAFGYPLTGLLSSDAILTTGLVNALSGIRNDERFLQISAQIQPGNSGGPLLDMDGHVVGVVSEELSALYLARTMGRLPQNVNFAIKSGVVRDFLDANRVHYERAPSTEKLSPADVGDIARKFTVRVECSR
jgi:S1-C subfamily serine protease